MLSILVVPSTMLVIRRVISLEDSSMVRTLEVSTVIATTRSSPVCEKLPPMRMEEKNGLLIRFERALNHVPISSKEASTV